jgi:hypothetical protein
MGGTIMNPSEIREGARVRFVASTVIVADLNNKIVATLFLVAGIVGIAILFLTLFKRRNDQVMAFRNGIIDAIFRAAAVDHVHGIHDAMWRIDTYEAVSYDAMLYRFWVPLRVDRFYSDQGFILPTYHEGDPE